MKDIEKPSEKITKEILLKHIDQRLILTRLRAQQ